MTAIAVIANVCSTFAIVYRAPGVIALQLISGVWLVQRLGYILTTLDIGSAYGSLITDLLIRKVGDRGDHQ